MNGRQLPGYVLSRIYGGVGVESCHSVIRQEALLKADLHAHHNAIARHTRDLSSFRMKVDGDVLAQSSFGFR